MGIGNGEWFLNSGAISVVGNVLVTGVQYQGVFLKAL